MIDQNTLLIIGAGCVIFTAILSAFFLISVDKEVKKILGYDPEVTHD